MGRSNGSVVLLVGPSCAGKSTLAKAVQEQSAKPYLLMSLDSLFASVPEGWASSGAHAGEGFRYERKPSESGSAGPDVRRVAYGPVGWKILQGFHRSVAAYAVAGVDVIVDDMLLDVEDLADWAVALQDVPTLLVSVIAPMAELVRREHSRQVHPTPGLVAGHFDLHEGIKADARIDTSVVTPADAARCVLQLATSTEDMRALLDLVGR